MPTKLLIVDDEPSLLEVLEQYLVRLGYEVVACRSGDEAWKTFEQAPLSYGLILADATLPGLSSAELLTRMIERNPKLGLLVSSGYPFDMSMLPPALADRVIFLQKPFTPRMLAGAIERLLPKSPSA